ncbi:hypothetical protein [Companilactobacillus baiquanensis]|uniref:Uncharacterized protein n=1 Tax=Companilactobacillus baiquanensis TaxID=2486005 RepID=A0ABW1USB6_9LACO|nr:hypothetical protein [Companilactobacillus baiquanensis]
MAEAPNAMLTMKDIESDGNDNNRFPEEDLKVNDSNYKSEVKTWLSTMEQGRKIDFTKSTYGNSYLNKLDYLKGMEDSSASDIVVKILENEGSTDVLSENLSGKELDFGFQYLPIDENYEIHYIGVGGPKDSQVIYIDKGQNSPDGKLPSTPTHAGIPKNTVPGYRSFYIDENDISFDETTGVLTYKVGALPDSYITVNEYDKNKKLVKTVKWDLAANETIPIQPDSTTDPLFPTGKIRYTDVEGVLSDSFYQDLIKDKNLILDGSTFSEVHSDGSPVQNSAAQAIGLYSQMYDLKTDNLNMGYITSFIMNTLIINGNVGEIMSWNGKTITSHGTSLTINAVLDYVDESGNTTPTVP